MTKQPTYSPDELIAKIKAVDLEGMDIIWELLQEEQDLYDIMDYTKIYKAFNWRKAELKWQQGRK